MIIISPKAPYILAHISITFILCHLLNVQWPIISTVAFQNKCPLHYADYFGKKALNNPLDYKKLSKSIQSKLKVQNDYGPSIHKSELGHDIRHEFPMLDKTVYGNPLIYLDNAATTFKPRMVLEALNNFYTKFTSNVHRSTHHFSTIATEAYESSRDTIAEFINANREEVIFTSGATESINLIAQSYGMENIHEGDEIILSIAEHHSNLVPWQNLAKKKSAILKFINLTSNQTIDSAHFKKLLSTKTKIVAITQSSNVLGYETPLTDIIADAHKVGAKVVIDACQSIANKKINVKDLNCDFLVASGHKMCGPTSIGFLYGKYYLLENMSPYQFGGEMIENVDLHSSTFATPPIKFEAGSPRIAEAIGLAHAAKFLNEIGISKIENYENALGSYLYNRLASIPGLELYGPHNDIYKRTNLVSFSHKNLHPYDIATFMDQKGVALRAGHHCAQPLHNYALNKTGTLRASSYIYNTMDEIDNFISKLKETLSLLERF